MAVQIGVRLQNRHCEAEFHCMCIGLQFTGAKRSHHHVYALLILCTCIHISTTTTKLHLIRHSRVKRENSANNIRPYIHRPTLSVILEMHLKVNSTHAVARFLYIIAYSQLSISHNRRRMKMI